MNNKKISSMDFFHMWNKINKLYYSHVESDYRGTFKPSYIIGGDYYGQVKTSSQEQINKLNKTNKMRTRKFYHTFEFEKRQITLCLLVEEQEQNIFQQMRNEPKSSSIKIGYSVCVPEDKFQEGLSKKISLGRAESDKARLEEIGSISEFAFDSGILIATARIYERKIKRGELVIKGLSNAIEKENSEKENTKVEATESITKGDSDVE